MKIRMGLMAVVGAFVLTAISMPAFALKTAPAISKPKAQNIVALKKTKGSKKVALKSGSKTVIGCRKR